MTHFFDRRDPWGNRLSLWIVVSLAFVAPLCWWSLSQIRLENDEEKWLPQNDPELRASRWTHEQFPIEERILLTWEGSSINDSRLGKLVDQLAGKKDGHGVKRGGLPYISSVIEPLQALDVMQRNGIDPHDAVRRLEGTIIGAGPLRLRMTETGRSALRKTKRELQTAMKAKFGLDLAMLDASPDLTPQISVPAPIIVGEATRDPSSPTILSANGLLSDNASIDHDLQVAWKGMRIGSDATVTVANWLTSYVPEKGDGKPLVESSFFAPGSPVALSVGISEAGMADKAETVSAIRSACKSAGIPPEALHMAGAAVSSTQLNDDVKKAVWDTSFPLFQIHRRSVILTSMLVSALLAYALVRSVRLTAMVVFVSLSTMFCSMAVVSATGGTMNMVLIVLPTLLVVLTMSGTIRVVHSWQYAACKDESTAIVKTARTSWGPCFLASLTAAIGLISLCTSNLAPVREFGLYAVFATIFSFLMIAYGLPALMQLWGGKPPTEREMPHAGWRMIGRMLTVHSGWQSLAVLAVCIGCCVGLTRFHTETKVIRYFPERSRIAHDYWAIETSLAGVMPIETVIRFDQQSQKDTNFLDRMEIVRQVQEKMRVHPEISGSSSLADFEPVTERPPEDASFLQRTKFNKRATTIQQRIRDGEIPASRSFYTISEQGNDLEHPGDGRLNQPGDELWRITAQLNVMTDNDFSVVMSDLHHITQDVLKLHPGSNHLITGSVPLFVRTQEAVLKSLTGSFTLACVLILGVFMICLRSIGAGLVAMIPSILPIAVVFGVHSWLEQRVDIGSLITASIALGIGVSGALHYLTSMQLAMKNGRTRPEAIVDALVHCTPVMWRTSVVIAIGMLALVPAELVMISRFGWMMASMIGVGMLSNMVLMPQLVCGPLGMLFEPASPKRDLPAVTVETEVTVAECVPTTSEETATIPTPHIPVTKKRRSSTRPGTDR